MESNVILVAPPGDYVELAGGRGYTGKHWRKHILNLGELIHPTTGEKLAIDDAFYQKLSSNFDRKVCDIVAAPLANDSNKHVEGPLSNAGEVMGLHREGDKVFVDLDVRDPKTQQGLKNKTILGASAFLHLDYTDNRTGKKVGPTLLHSCFTNRPYVTGLDDYQEVTATMADSEGDVVVLAQEEVVPTKDEMIAALKSEHGIDVEALTAAATQQADFSALTAQLTAALGEQTPAPAAGSTDEVSLTDVVQAVAQVSSQNVALTAQVDELKLAQATTEVEGYIATGRVMPKQKNAFIKLALSDRDTLAEMLPDKAIVAMNDQAGNNDPDPAGHHDLDIDAEVARLTEVMGEQSAVKGARTAKK
jgi:hypothetical protein